MSKYKRHSQGGRFKTANFGDLGLRAYKDQQANQINSLKEQSKEEAQLGYEHLREMRGAASREIEHNRQLQNFYNKRDNLAIQNTEFRGKTEYDKLMGEADEYKKKAKFWSDFSSTYAAQYIKAATDIEDLASTEISNRQQDIIFKDPKFIEFEASYSKLNNIASKAQLDEAVNILRDKNATEEQKSHYLGHIVELGFRMNHKTKLALLQRELNNWPNEARELRSLAAMPGKYPEGHEKAGQYKPALVWNADTVGQFYYLRARELLRAYGVDPASQAGREFLKGVEEEATKERKKLGDSATANTHTEYRDKLSDSTKNLVGKNNYAVNSDGTIVVSGPSAIVYNNEFNTRVVFEGSGWRKNDNGEVIKPTENNLYNNMVSIMKSDIASGRFKSKEQARRHTILQLKPKGDVKYEDDGRTMSYSENDSWLGQHGERLQKEFDEAWDAYEKELKTKADEKKITDDWTTVEDLKKRGLASVNGSIKPTLPDGSPNPEYLDLSDKATIDRLMKDNWHHGADSETIKFLGNYKIYNAYDLNGDTVTFDLTTKYKAGKLKELREHLSYLPEPIQKQWESKLKQLEILERKDLLGAKLTAKGSSILQGILGTDAAKPLALNTEHFQATIKYIEQDFLATLEEEYEKDPEATDSDIIARVRTEINRKINVKNADGTMGEGVYRRSNTGTNALSTKFLIDPAASTADEKAEATLDQVEAKFLVKSGLGNPTAFNNGMKELATDGKFQVGKDPNNRVRLVSLDDADDAVIAINEGRPVPFNASIEHIWKNQPRTKDGKRQYDRRDIWNAYFKGVGIDTTIKPDSVSFAVNNSENSTLKSSTNTLSETDQCVVGAVSKMVDEGICDITQKSAERERIDQNNSTRDNFVLETLNGTMTEEQQKILYPHSHTLRKDTHIPWWIKPWAEKPSTKSPFRLNRL